MQVERVKQLVGNNEIAIPSLSRTLMFYRALTHPVIIVLCGAFLAILASVLFSPMVMRDAMLVAILLTMGGALIFTIMLKKKFIKKIFGY